MPHTYTYADALNFCGSTFDKMLTDNYGGILLDQTNSTIWNAADWRISLGTFAPFYVSPLEQDYTAPTVQIPADFLGLRTAQIAYVPGQPAMRDDLNIARFLQQTSLQGMPTDISYAPAKAAFRLFPRPSASMGAANYMIEGTYKKTPTKVTAANISSALPWDDTYFRVFTSGLLYHYFASRSDPRAGQCQLTKGGSANFTGQLATFAAAVQEMAAEEDLNLGDVTIAPSQALVSPYSLY